jgi:hypothetical protein
MTRKTQVIWDISTYTDDLNEAIKSEVQLLKDQEKTDGAKVTIEDSPVPGQTTTIRTWISLEVAEQWIIFINSLGVTPVSTGILPEETP